MNTLIMIMDIESFRERRLLDTGPHGVAVTHIRGVWRGRMGRRNLKNNEMKLKSVLG